jgi:macrodomain Ter protein organizer (MatP/YcbG family)
MAAKQSSSVSKKEGEITRSEKTSATQQAESVLKNAKERAGDVIQVVISDRTTIELPAHLSQEEIDARVERYIRLHRSKI